MRKRVTGKKAVALVMASLMIASMAGCGSSGSESSGSGNTSVKEDGSIDTSKHEVINMLVLGNKPTNGRLEAMLDKLNPILTEKVNAELEFTYIEWTDWQTQYNLKLLSGDSSLDLICTATDWLGKYKEGRISSTFRGYAENICAKDLGTGIRRRRLGYLQI